MRLRFFRRPPLFVLGTALSLSISAAEPAAPSPTLLEKAYVLDAAEGRPRDAAAAAQLYAAAATAGDAHAHLRLGYLCEIGDGVPQDYAAARAHYQAAADLGLASARVPLAMCHLEGWGGPVDREAFAREIRLAAEAGDAPAQRILGNLLSLGIVVPKDFPAGLVWLERAAKSDGVAQHDLGVMLEAAHQFVTNRNAEIARNWYQLSAESEYLAGMRAMARTCIDRSHGAPDWESFHRWMALADEAGDAEAPYIVALVEMQHRPLSAANESRARACLERAAERGNRHAVEILDLLGTGQTLDQAFTALMTETQEDRYVRRLQRSAGAGPTRPPVPFKIVEPIYPLALRLTGVTGKVTLQFVVDTAGRVQKIQTISATHPLLAERATAAVAQWRFEAARKDGRAVNCNVQLEFPFELRDETVEGVDGLLGAARDKAQLLGPEFTALTVDLRLARPALHLPIPPSGKAPAGERRYALVLLALDATGQPLRGRVLEAQPKELGEELLAIALAMPFQPREVRGEAVPSNVLLPFFSSAMILPSPDAATK